MQVSVITTAVPLTLLTLIKLRRKRVPCAPDTAARGFPLSSFCSPAPHPQRKACLPGPAEQKLEGAALVTECDLHRPSRRRHHEENISNCQTQRTNIHLLKRMFHHGGTKS